MTERAGIGERLERAHYIADEAIATALQLAVDLGRPLLVEGAAGVGKTELAKALARVLDTQLIRLQCYEGLDATAAIYEWNYQRQLLTIKANEHTTLSPQEVEDHIFSERFLLRRPLLQAISEPRSCVLLIDEIDRADEEFEAYLLELLSDYQITIPELGTITATSVPHVIATSNGTRELSDALRRRCLYYYMAYPAPERELAIIRDRYPRIENELSAQVARFVHALRKEDLDKTPGIAETLDWVAALLKLDVAALESDVQRLHSTLICLLKTEADLKSVTPQVLGRLVGQAA
ncbi:MAG: AAA family ATPase [Gammaproteobacteria bacterium]